jgi:membrane fusion protein (multidrug efflux system)
MRVTSHQTRQAASLHHRTPELLFKKPETGNSNMQTIKPGRLTDTRTLIATACTCLLLLAGCGDKSKQTAVKPPPPDVQVDEVRKEKIPIIMTFSGTVKSIKTVKIIPRVSGYINKRYFDEGTIVRRGDPLYLIDPQPYQAELDAELAQIKVDEASAAFWKSEEIRYTKLAKVGAASIQNKEKAAARHLEMLANIDKDKANIKSAQLNLGYTKITAPFDGRIQETRINVGQLVHEQQDVLTTLKKIDPIYVIFNVSRRQTSHIQRLKREGLAFASWKNFNVEVKLADGTLYSRPGRLNYISVQINNSTDTMEFRAVFPNPIKDIGQIALISGQYVPVNLTVGEDPNTLLVPGPALIQSQVGTQVYVVNKNNKVESRTVEVGQAYKQQWIIKKGLKKGERVIYEGLQKVHPGDVVNIKSKDKESTLKKG